jgi:hypothetical protein
MISDILASASSLCEKASLRRFKIQLTQAANGALSFGVGLKILKVEMKT